jgi:DNA (cytosine-5)-methyltransferase 1
MAAFYEFFAGGGMARAGLGGAWTCLFANDIDARKAAAYQANWGPEAFRLGDIGALAAGDLPGHADLAWASFPCQDLSLAGGGAGLAGKRSGAFYPFWRLIGGLAREGRAPAAIVLENVCGALTSHGGADFAAICRTFAEHGYRCGPLVIDAALFTPQSRPRLFMIGVREGAAVDPALLSPRPGGPFHPPALIRAVDALPADLAEGLLAWNLPAPARRNRDLADLIEDDGADIRWHSPDKTARLIALMSGANLAKLEAAKAAGGRRVGCVYRRTRPTENGGRRQRAEARFDDLAGCLRTPAGGSSRQGIVVVDGARVRTRLISARETARLMGLPDDYRLPKGYSDAYHLTGDGVVVDVVRHLAGHLIEPLLEGPSATRAAA